MPSYFALLLLCCYTIPKDEHLCPILSRKTNYLENIWKIFHAVHKNFFILYLQIKKSIDHFKVRHNEMLNFYLARAILLLLLIKKYICTLEIIGKIINLMNFYWKRKREKNFSSRLNSLRIFLHS